ncbi:hypothetical protein HMPREF1402_00638 [Helicobacter pylori GAM121Aii]|nr:hypothetical protein HMPREF1402_00638 [Helicobacter pylori GAM121Aii]
MGFGWGWNLFHHFCSLRISHVSFNPNSQAFLRLSVICFSSLATPLPSL